MVIPIMLILVILLFIIMWGWIVALFFENAKIKAKIEELINQPLTVEQKEELDNLQLDLDTNAYRSKNAKTVVLVFATIFLVSAFVILWLNQKYQMFTYDGLLYNLKLDMLLIILFFTPAYIGLELISNTEGASGDITSKLKLSEELKPGEEVEV
ncbi:MAG: hypothetical protein KA120_07695 [Candidatus Goldbacteria bacterium]|mgnify:CR=1 FL=1|nr:hypothetical protein [Candidatus Goldiibacteriota bacterium]HPD19281.1 hypothetical protein [Candidatus Goldiibacteriota bacterium]